MTHGTEALQKLEAECAAGRTAPRVKLSDIESSIKYKFFLNGGEIVGATVGHEVESDLSSSFDSLKLLSLCILVMNNGFTIVGKSAPASPENFDQELGYKLAYDDAIKQLWPLMGFALRESLSRKK